MASVSVMVVPEPPAEEAAGLTLHWLLRRTVELPIAAAVQVTLSSPLRESVFVGAQYSTQQLLVLLTAVSNMESSCCTEAQPPESDTWKVKDCVDPVPELGVTRNGTGAVPVLCAA